MSFKEFRERTCVEKHEYREFKRLSTRTIIGPLRELEELGDVTGDVQYTTRGRKIVVIKPNPQNGFASDPGERIRPEYWCMLKNESG